MVSLIIGLQEGVCSIGAFICMGFVLKKIKPRTLCLIGGAFCVVGVTGCSIIDQVEYLLITHSLCFGMALASTYGTSLLILNHYFTKRRALAVSLSTSGCSVGGVIFPMLLRNYFNTYDFRGGILMAGGTLMHIFIFAMLLISVEDHKRPTVTKPRVVSVRDAEDLTKVKLREKPWTVISNLRMCLGLDCQDDEDTQSDTASTRERYPSPSFQESSTCINRAITHSQNLEQNKFHFPGKVLNFETFNSKLEICEEGVPLKIDPPSYFDDNSSEIVNASTNEKSNPAINGKPQNVLDSGSPFGSYSSHINGSNSSIYLHPDYHNRHHNRINILRSQAGLDSISNFDTEAHHHYRNASRLTSSRQTLSSSIIFHSTSTLHTVADMVTADHDLQSHITNTNNNESNARSTFRRLCDMCNDNTLFHSASYWLLIVFFFCACIGHTLPQSFIPALAKEKGISDDDSAFFLSLLNVLDIPSHLIPGVLVNFGVARATKLCILPILIVGIVCFLTPFYNSYETLLLMSILFGLFGGFYFSMQSVIIIETLGMTRFASTIGFFLLVTGMGSAVSYPIAGAIKDFTGSYTGSFTYMATMAILSTVLLIFLPLARKYDVKRGILKDDD